MYEKGVERHYTNGECEAKVKYFAKMSIVTGEVVLKALVEITVFSKITTVEEIVKEGTIDNYEELVKEIYRDVNEFITQVCSDAKKFVEISEKEHIYYRFVP